MNPGPIARWEADLLGGLADGLEAEENDLPLVDFVTLMAHGRYDWARHLYLLARCLELLYEGRITRLMVVMPPRHGKSWLASRFFPAWWRGRRPDDQMIVTSHNAPLAQKFSRQVRGLVKSRSWPWPNLVLSRERSAVTEWELDGHDGSYAAFGVSQSPTGRGGDLIDVDDPVANRENAQSEVQRETTWGWYREDLYTRRMPGARLLLIQTRWHADDLAGRLLDRMELGVGDTWDVLHLPALCMDTPEPYALTPGTPRWRELFTAEDEARFGTVAGRHDPIGRVPGEPLWPERWSLGELMQTKAVLEEKEGEGSWWALYQGVPRSPEGALWKADMLRTRYRDVADLGVRRCLLSVDSAFKTGVSSAFSCIAVWGEVDWNGRQWFALLDVWRARVAFDELYDATVQRWEKWRARLDGQCVPEALVEDKASGQSLVQVLNGRTKVPTIEYKLVKGQTKESRAESALPPFRAGRIILPEAASWLADWIDEHLGFPTAKFRDQVDTTSQAIDVLYTARLRPAASSASETVKSYGAPPAQEPGALPPSVGTNRQQGYNARRGRLLG